MTRMADEAPEQDRDAADDRRRNLLGATWFRALMVVIVLGVVAVVAVPYVLDWVNPPPEPVAVVKTLPATPGRPATPPPSSPSPTTEAKREASATESKTATPTPVEPKKPAAAVARADGGAKPAAAKAEPAKKAAAPKPAAAPSTKAAASAGGTYWVQVGAFKDPETAKRLAGRLRAENYRVSETATQAQAGVTGGAVAPGAGGDRYDILVSGASASELSAKLAAKGLAASPATTGVVIKPSLPLRDAVALSKDLAAEGFKVQVRRAGGAAGTAESASPATGRETLYRVRVGAFPDRATAAAVVGELQAKGYKPFIARGRE